MGLQEFNDMMFGVILEFFRIHRSLDPVQCQIFLGQYGAYYPSPLGPGALKKKSIQFSRDVKMPFAYSVNFDLKPIAAIHNEAHGFELNTQWQPSGKLGKMHLMEGRRIADLAVDNLAEMRACKFPWAANIADLTPSARAEFARSLGEIKFMPDPGPYSNPESVGGQFIQDLAAYCTYDDDGKYFKKWRKGKENGVADISTLTSEYYKNIFQEQVLVHDRVYVAVLSEVQYELWLLEPDGKGSLKEKLVYQLVDHFTAGQMHVDAQSAQKETVFFYTVHGASGWNPPRFKLADASQRATQRLADPEAMVIATAGKDAKKLLKISDDFDWFVEMAARYFPARFSFIDMNEVNKSYGSFLGPDLFRKQMKQKIKDALLDLKGDDPITTDMRARVQKMMDDPAMLVIPQGVLLGEHDRFVGIDEHGPWDMAGPFCYFRNAETGYCWKIPLLPLVQNLLVGSVAQEVWESTRGMLPFIQAVVWAGVMVIGIEIIGPKAVYDWVKKQAGKKAIEALVHELIKMAKPALIALLTEIIASIFKLSRIKAFAEGFFHGYVVHAVYQHFVDHVKNYVTEGPLEYRLAKTALHFHQTVEALSRKIELLREELSADGEKKALKKGLEHFENMSIHLVQGIALLTGAIYWVEHKDALPLAQAMVGTAKGEAPDLERWNDEAAGGLTAFIREMTSAIVDPDQLEKEAKKLGEKLDSVDRVLKPLFADPVKGALITGGAIYGGMFVLNKGIFKLIGGAGKLVARAAGKVPRPVWLLGALAGTLYLVEKWEDASADEQAKIEDKAANVLKFIEESVKNFFEMDEKTAHLFGELTGNLFGAFMVDSALHHGKEAFDKMFKGRKVLSKVSDVVSFHADLNLHHGKIGWVIGMVKLLLYRYLDAYNELVKHGLLAKKRDESAFAKMISDIDVMSLKNRLDQRGLGHLAQFRSDNEQRITFEKIGLALVSVLRVLEDDQREYLKNTYGNDLERYRKDLKVFAEALDETGVTKWAKDRAQWVKDNYAMVYHHFLLHLRAAIHQLVLAFGEAFTPFTNNGYSWISLLQELGLDIGTIEKLRDKLHDDLKLFK